jgi:hypothetical protein
VVEFVRGAVERRDEPPESDGPSLSKSIVIVVSVCVWELVMKYEEVVIV